MSEPFHVHVRGVRFEGTYDIRGRMLTIRSAYGSHRAPIGLMVPQKLAKALLRAVLRDVARVYAPAPSLLPRRDKVSSVMGCDHTK